MTTVDRLRLTVTGHEDLVVEVGAEDLGPLIDGGDVSAPEPSVEIRELVPTAGQRAAGQRSFELTLDGWALRVHVESAERADLRARARRGRSDHGHEVRQAIRARIPGRIVHIWVAPGQTVEAGERLLAIEAMKMENEVRAPHSGVVERVVPGMGDTVEAGDELVTLD